MSDLFTPAKQDKLQYPMTTQLTELVSASGLEATKQNQIAEALGTFFNKAAEWDATIQSIVITSPEETGKMKMAREGRLTLKNMRLDAEKVVSAKRSEVKNRMANDLLEDKLWLKAGQMMEATFKTLESKLEEKEKFAERWEAEQREKLKAERTEKLMPYSEFVPVGAIDLGRISQDEFTRLLTGAESAKQAKEDAERKAEADRIAREKAEAEQREAERAEAERQRIENERLKAEAEAREKQIAEERAKAEAEAREREEQARKEREAMELKAKQEREQAEAQLKAEREAREKAEAEIRAKAEAEAKAKADEQARIQAEEKARIAAEKKAKAAPDKDKLTAFARTLSEMEIPKMATDEGAKIASDVRVLMGKVTAFIAERTAQL